MVGILSLIFGIAGILTSFIYIGIFLCVVGITLGIVGLTDCFSEKNFPLAGLLLSILGSVMSVYVIASDMDANKLIVIYNSDDKIYMSNYKQVSEALDELANYNIEDDISLEWQNELGESENINLNANGTTDDQTESAKNIEVEEPNRGETIAVQPDRDWYMGRSEEDEIKDESPKESGDKILYQDENVIITYEGITEGSWGNGYDICITVENLSQRTLTIQCRETSINGYMVEPICSIEVASGKKNRDAISIMGDDADSIPMNMVNNVETKFHIFDFNDMFDFSYDTENIVVR